MMKATTSQDQVMRSMTDDVTEAHPWLRLIDPRPGKEPVVDCQPTPVEMTSSPAVMRQAVPAAPRLNSEMTAPPEFTVEGASTPERL